VPINIGANNAEFQLQIPAIDENADIQTAFRLYHYGLNSSGLGTLNPQSLAGYLDQLNKGKVSKAPTIIPNNANLNNAPYTESGFYAQVTNAGARTGLNYPKIPINIGLEYAGLLRVFNDNNGNIYQEYQVSGIPDQSVYWRAKFGNLAFSNWQGFAREGHVHDDLYFRKTESDNRYFPAIRFKTVKQPNIVNNVYTLSKNLNTGVNDEDTILLMNNLSVPHNLVVPQDVSDPNLNIAVGTTIRIIQANTGQTSVIPNSAQVTINSTPGNKLRTIWSTATLVKIGTNSWVLSGDLQPNKTNSQLRNDVGIYVQQNQPVGNIQNGDLWFW
jgi:hypothetical protein